AECFADAGEQQPQVIIYLGLSRDCRARISSGVLLTDRDRRTDADDLVHIRLVHPFEKLASVGRKALNVATLALGIDSIERQTRLTGAADAGQNCKLADRYIDGDVSKVMYSRAPNADDFFRHYRYRWCQLHVSRVALLRILNYSTADLQVSISMRLARRERSAIGGLDAG